MKEVKCSLCDWCDQKMNHPEKIGSFRFCEKCVSEIPGTVMEIRPVWGIPGEDGRIASVHTGETAPEGGVPMYAIALLNSKYGWRSRRGKVKQLTPQDVYGHPHLDQQIAAFRNETVIATSHVQRFLRASRVWKPAGQVHPIWGLFRSWYGMNPLRAERESMQIEAVEKTRIVVGLS